MKFKVLLTSFVFAFVMLLSFGFVGCDNKNYTYAQSQQVYDQMIEQYPMLFKSTGYVYIRYNNTNMAYPIVEGEDVSTQSQSGAIKLTNACYNFTKLARYNKDPNTGVVNAEAVFEPTLNASMLVLATYFKNSGDSGVNIPQNKLNTLHQTVADLSQAIGTLNAQKVNLETKCRNDDFESDSRAQGALKNYCSSFLDAIDKACAAADCFIDIYTNHIYSTLVTKDGETKLSPLAVNLEYLTKIADIACYYNNFYLYDINEQIKKGPQTAGSEIEIDSDFDWVIMNEYQQIKNLETNDDSISQIYNVIKGYDPVFYANKQHALNSIQTYRAIKNIENMTLEQTIAVSKMEEFKNDCKIVDNYFETLTNRIIAFNAV